MNLVNYSKVPCYLFLMITFLFRLKTYIIKQTVNHGLPKDKQHPSVQNAVLKKKREVTQTDISPSIGGIKTSSPKLLVLRVSNIIVPC